MFQSYALFPHMSVEQNVAFGLKMERLPAGEIRARTAEMLALVRLEGFAKRRPDQLSGGQRQRVALARALAKRPKILLLDEPLAALDKKLREETQFELKAIQARLGSAFMIVTHDQDEAMVLADRMAVMDAGRIIQIGAPREVYEQPASRQVAGFIGEINLFEPADAPGYEVSGQWLAVRPERMWIDREAKGPLVFAGQVSESGYLGDWTTFVVRLADGRTVRISRPNTGGPAAFAKGDQVLVGFDPAHAVVLSQ
jgi:putrescine transport system ATP-binding protein